MIEKKSISFPIWVEAIIILALLTMAGVEYQHDQWIWAMIFGASGVLFGIGTVARLTSEGKHGRK